MTDDGISPVKHGWVVQIPRELIEDGASAMLQREIGIALGAVKISDEERADRERRRLEHLGRVSAYEAAVEVLAVELAQVTDPLLSAILDLHHRDRFNYCEACEGRGYEAESIPWPCRTVELIAEAHGITVPEGNL